MNDPAELALPAHDIAAIERATLAAVAPATVEAVADGDLHWLLPFDAGTVGRARSAVPLAHHLAPADAPSWIERVHARYAARHLPPAWRLAQVPAFAELERALVRAGCAMGKPTLTQVARAADVQAVAGGAPLAELEAAPDAGWSGVFLGPGFDPVDGAHRVRVLSRAEGTLFASVRDAQGRTQAAGALAFGHGWASVHGMRTEQAARGQGLAGRVLAAMAQAALARGIERMFLQVEAGNASALALYRRAGFRTVWRYAYWG